MYFYRHAQKCKKKSKPSRWRSTGQSCLWSKACPSALQRQAEIEIAKFANINSLLLFRLFHKKLPDIRYFAPRTYYKRMMNSNTKHKKYYYTARIDNILEHFRAERADIQARVLTRRTLTEHCARTFCAAQRTAIVARDSERSLRFDGPSNTVNDALFRVAFVVSSTGHHDERLVRSRRLKLSGEGKLN